VRHTQRLESNTKRNAKSGVRVFSYIVSRDYGFAPNPFHGFCTLADCKPVLRRVVEVGDIVVGTSPLKAGRRLVFVMQVTEKLTFEAYWVDPRFARKKPKFRGNVRDAYGDNIYEPQSAGGFIQHKSHHSLPDGSTNLFNRNKDTGTNAVLVSHNYAYWGADGPPVPEHLTQYQGWDLRAPTQGHVSRFPQDFVDAVGDWFDHLPERGVCGVPAKWK